MCEWQALCLELVEFAAMAPSMTVLLRCDENSMIRTIASSSSRVFPSPLSPLHQRSKRCWSNTARSCAVRQSQTGSMYCASSPYLVPPRSRRRRKGDGRTEGTKGEKLNDHRSPLSSPVVNNNSLCNLRGSSTWRAKLRDHDDVDVGAFEDSAAFSLQKQILSSWMIFSGLLSVVLAALYVVWIDPDLVGVGTSYIDLLENTLSNPHVSSLLFGFRSRWPPHPCE